MRLRAALCLACQFFTLSICGDVAAQLTITDPGPTGIRQVSLSTPEGIIAARRDASNPSQIRVTVQYLLVDDSTRAAIYEGFESSSIKYSMTIPETLEPVDLHAVETPSKSTTQITSPSRVTTCVLDESEVALVLQKAGESQSSTVSNTPSIVLLEGKEAEMNDVVQHPFVVDIVRDGDLIKPSVQAFDDGTRLRLLAQLANSATLPSPDPQQPVIGLTCEILSSRVLDVRADRIFGLRDDSMSVHAPIHQLTSTIASEQLARGQTLLIDPHVTKSSRVQSESTVPVIGKIPYVGRSFRNVSVASVNQHMMVLLRPSIEKHVR